MQPNRLPKGGHLDWNIGTALLRAEAIEKTTGNRKCHAGIRLTTLTFSCGRPPRAQRGRATGKLQRHVSRFFAKCAVDHLVL
jgi:hypothetical protein